MFGLADDNELRHGNSCFSRRSRVCIQYLSMGLREGFFFYGDVGELELHFREHN